MQVVPLGTVCFIDENQNGVTGIQHAKVRRAGAGIAVLLDHCKGERRARLAQHLFHIRYVLANANALACERRSPCKLPLEILPISDDHDLELPKGRNGPHLPDEEDHREALAGPLRVPDDATASVVLSILLASLS